MFDFVRNHRRWMQFILLLLILPSFVFVGIQGYSSFMEGERALAEVAGEPVTRQEYDAAVRERLDQMRAMLGEQFDAQVFDTPAMRQGLLDEIINTRLVALEAGKRHFSASDEQLRATIQSIPAVQEDGKFSNARYRDALAAQGMTPVMFEAQLRRDLALRTVLGPIAQSATVPEAVMARLVAAATERRQIQTLRIGAADYLAKVSVGEEDVKAYYDANRARFEVPERVDAQYVVLDGKAVSANVSVSEDDIKGYYEQNQARYRQDEQRRASHILIAADGDKEAARKKAEALAEQAKAPGADFARLARENSQDPGSAANGGDLDWFGRGMMVKAFEDAAFGMQEGEVSGVVPSDFGFHVIKLTGVRPAVVKPLAEVRAQVLEEISQQQAARRFSEAAEQFTNLVYEQSDTLEPAAQKFDLRLQDASGIARSGQSGNEVLDNPKVRQALFSEEVLREKRNSGVIELAPDRLVAVRMTRHLPATVRPLEEVADAIRKQVAGDKALELARADGEARLKALEEKDTTQGFGGAVTVARNDPGELAPSVLNAVMKAPADKLPAFVGAVAGDAYVIARIGKVEAAPAPEAALLENEKTMMARRLAQAEELAVLKTLRGKYKVSQAPGALGQQPAE